MSNDTMTYTVVAAMFSPTHPGWQIMLCEGIAGPRFLPPVEHVLRAGDTVAMRVLEGEGPQLGYRINGAPEFIYPPFPQEEEVTA